MGDCAAPIFVQRGVPIQNVEAELGVQCLKLTDILLGSREPDYGGRVGQACRRAGSAKQIPPTCSQGSSGGTPHKMPKTVPQ
jgi:hypothetical protein